MATNERKYNSEFEMWISCVKNDRLRTQLQKCYREEMDTHIRLAMEVQKLEHKIEDMEEKEIERYGNE